MKKKKHLSRTLVLFSLIPALVITAAFIVINIITKTQLVKDKISTAAKLDIANVESFFADMHGDIGMLCELTNPHLMLSGAQNGALAVPDDDTMDTISSAHTSLSAWVKHNPNVNRISVITEDNKVLVSSNEIIEGQKSSIDEKYLSRLSRGEYIVTRLFNDEYANNARSFIIAQPLTSNNKYIGFIMMSIKADAINALLGNSNLFASGIVEVLDIGNNLVGSSSNEIKDGDPLQIQLNQQLNIHIEPIGSFKYKDGIDKRIAYYSRMHDTGWTVLYTASQNEFSSTILQTSIYSLIVIAIFAVIIMTLRQLVKFRLISPLNHLLDYLQQMNAGDYKSRIPYLGANEFSDIGSAFNNLMTKIEQDNRELTIKEERYRIANEQSNSIIFEYNVETDGFSCSANACEFANYPAFTHNFPESLIELQVLHSEDCAQFMRLLAAMRHGRRTGAMELRMRTYRDEYHWFSLLLTTITDTATFKPLRVIGKLTDIDEEKKMTANLTFKAERDPLTSIYNKSTTQSMITQKLSEREQDLFYALIVMDIDDFKHVNDGYGHQKGDSVLMDVASALMSQLRNDDVVGRIGGDEFMILLSAMPSREAVATKTTRLLCALRAIPLDEANGEYISASMGIALCPQDGTGFNQLYASADNALYVRKNAGKDGFSFYREAGAEN
ncbi:MAG: diguanylate cyclase [Oscillospiraceae bacterium]